MDEEIPEDHKHIFPRINDGGCWCGLTQAQKYLNEHKVYQVEKTFNKFAGVEEEEY